MMRDYAESQRRVADLVRSVSTSWRRGPMLERRELAGPRNPRGRTFARGGGGATGSDSGSGGAITTHTGGSGATVSDSGASDAADAAPPGIEPAYLRNGAR